MIPKHIQRKNIIDLFKNHKFILQKKYKNGNKLRYKRYKCDICNVDLFIIINSACNKITIDFVNLYYGYDYNNDLPIFNSLCHDKISTCSQIIMRRACE